MLTDYGVLAFMSGIVIAKTLADWQSFASGLRGESSHLNIVIVQPTPHV